MVGTHKSNLADCIEYDSVCVKYLKKANKSMKTETELEVAKSQWWERTVAANGVGFLLWWQDVLGLDHGDDC